ncbi:tetratricopeptide repeat protein [Paenibacillus antri]|uniref:Tetratricopeptide repeat protein n=2 Tax=Paenibacillus antri TaxID=2582848 RepID=A0A5R9G9K5_9BACL|nr:tetratricopeptide repeat protein [Paenibacillus antri]
MLYHHPLHVGSSAKEVVTMSGEKELQKAYESILGQHFEQAVEWFQKAIEQDPDNPDYHYKLSITYARSGRIDEALAHARKAASLAPDGAEYGIQVRALEAKQLIATAERLIAEGPSGDALATTYLRQALALDPLEEGAYVLLASTLYRMEEYTSAMAALKELLELSPNHRTASALLEQIKSSFAVYLEERT